MRITAANLTELHETLGELTGIAEELDSEFETWLGAREDRSAYDPEDVASARETIEGAFDELRSLGERLVATLDK